MCYHILIAGGGGLWNVLRRTVTRRTIFKHFSEKSPTSHVARHLSGARPASGAATSPCIKPGSCKDETGDGLPHPSTSNRIRHASGGLGLQLMWEGPSAQPGPFRRSPYGPGICSTFRLAQHARLRITNKGRKIDLNGVFQLL